MSKSKILAADELDTILRQIINSESGEIDKKLVKNTLSDKILNGDRRQIELILKAIFVNDRPRPLQQLIEHKVNLVVGKNSQTVLHWAVEAGASKCVRLLLTTHAKQEELWALKKDQFHVTPIHLAASRSSSKILKLLLEELENSGEMSSFLLDSNQRSPFHYAATAGSAQCCEELIIALQDLPIDQRDRFGQTALMYAVGSSTAEDVIRLLASKKPISISTRNNLGMTALHLAVLARNLAAIKILLEELHCPTDTFDLEFRTPLHYASLYGYTDEIKLLLASGASLYTQDQKGATPGHYAAQNSLPALKLLLEQSKQDFFDKDNRSTLMWAVIAQNSEVVNGFVSGELCIPLLPDAHDRKKQTALHFAALQGNYEIYKMLLRAGWKEKAKDIETAMPIHLAAQNGHSELIRQFKKAFHNVDEPDDNGRTPLFYACFGAKAHTVQIMVDELKANPNHLSSLKQTPLYCAAFSGSYPCCAFLIKQGCDIEARDVNNITPLDLARGKKNLAELFEQALHKKNPTSGEQSFDLDSD